jgi:maltooligosyltrehalose trehalohydrolase
MPDPRTDANLTLGATLENGGVRFRVWAPAADRVEVELADALVPMTREADDAWSAHVTGTGAGARYRFRLNGEASFPDPYSRSQPDGPHGASEVVDQEAFAWHDQQWQGVGIDGLVIYQCHIGTFTPEGTFDGAIQQLPRLKELGVSAIQPLPVAEYPGSRNWGYDGVDLFAPTRNYGGYEGFKRLVDAAHQQGLGVIVDVVYNHLGPDGNFLRAYSPDYFTDRYQTPWGEAINYDGPRSSRVRQLVLDNALYWLRELHADGLRLDATHAIFDSSPTHILAGLSQAVHDSLPPGRKVVLIAETHENDVRYLKPVEAGGFGLDAVWADDFHHVMRRYLAGDREGYYAKYAGTLEEAARCIEHGWLRGTDARGQPARQFVYVIQNHDQVGNRALGERLHHQIDIDRYRALSMLLLFLPTTPMLFMGQEFVASSPFQYFTDHNPELGRLVTEGRREEFAGFASFTETQVPDPQAESTFVRSKLMLSEAERAPGANVHALYQQLLDLRRTDPVLRVQDRSTLSARAMGEDVLTVLRTLGDDERLLVVNFGDTPRTVTEFGSGWHVLLDSGASSQAVTLRPRSASIFARKRG